MPLYLLEFPVSFDDIFPRWYYDFRNFFLFFYLSTIVGFYRDFQWVEILVVLLSLNAHKSIMVAFLSHVHHSLTLEHTPHTDYLKFLLIVIEKFLDKAIKLLFVGVGSILRLGIFLLRRTER